MAYTPTTWVDGTTSITATQLNRVETGVSEAHDLVLDVATSTLSLGGTIGDTVTLPAGFVIAMSSVAGGNYGDVVFEMTFLSTWFPLATAQASGGGAARELVQVFSDGANVRARRVTSLPGGSSVSVRRMVIA